MKLPMVYIAGPYTKPDPVANTALAMGWWDRLQNDGLCAPVCPHWSMFQHFRTPRPWEQWLAYDFQVILRCDAVLRLHGESEGADKEEEFCRDNAIPVFYDREALYEWCRAYADAQVVLE